MEGFKIEKKNYNERFLKELKIVRKTNDYFEMQKMIQFYNKILSLLSNFKDQIDIIELNEDPYIKTENFEINLSSFLLYINEFEYLLFSQLDSYDKFKKKDLSRFYKVFMKYSNKKGFIIVWNEETLKSVLISKKDLYRPIEEVFNEITHKLKSLEELLSHLVKKKEEIPIELRFQKIQDYDLFQDFETILFESFKKKYENKKKIIDKKILNQISPNILHQILDCFDDFLKNKIKENEFRIILKKIYKFKE